MFKKKYLFSGDMVEDSYSKTDSTAARKNLFLISLVRLEFQMIDSFFNADQAFAMRILTSVAVDSVLLPKYVKLFTVDV